MSSSTIRFYRGANAPPVPISFGGDVDLTGSAVQLEIVPVPGAAPVVFSSAAPSPQVTLDPPSRVLLSYTDAFVASLPARDVARWQAFRVVGGVRERIGAGKVWVGGDGDWMEDAGASVEVPGVMGPPGGVTPEYEAAYQAVTGIYTAISAPPKTIEAAAYALLPDDLGKVLRFTQACVITLPATLPAGFYCVPRWVGSGAPSWVTAAGATKHEYPAGTRIAAQWASVTVSVDSNVGGGAAVWLIEGAIL